MFDNQPGEAVLNEADASNALPRTLGPGALTALGVSGIVGTGVFIMTGMAAHDQAGPALIVSFLIAALACIAAALCYAEFASRVPEAGSAYTYAFVTLGKGFAWLVGWNMVLEYGLAAASVAQGWSHYFQSLMGGVGLKLPAGLSGAPVDYSPTQGGLTTTGALLDLPALLAVLAMTWIVLRGIKVSMAFNYAMLILKLGVILFIIVVGAFYIHPQNWTPFAPFGWGGMTLLGKTIGKAGAGGAPVGVLAGASLVFYAYLGFEAITAYTEEARKPRRDVPIGIIASVLIATLLYIAVTAVLTGMTPYNHIDVSAPLSEAFRQVGLPWAQLLIALGATVGITSVLLIIMMSYPRILLAIGRDGLISRRFFAELHPRHRTPWKAILAMGLVTAPLAALTPLRFLANLVVMATLFSFILVSVAILVLRRARPAENPPFRTPFGPLIPIISIIVCFGLMLALPPSAWLQLGLWMLAGSALYLLYGRRQGVVARTPGEQKIAVIRPDGLQEETI